MELLRVFLDLKKVHTKTNVFSLDIGRCTMLNSASIVIQKTNKFCMYYEILMAKNNIKSMMAQF
jgi:hypothetical protein